MRTKTKRRALGGLATGLVTAVTALVAPAVAQATPASTPTVADRCFVDRSYRAFTGTAPSAADLTAAAARLASGTTRTTFVGELAAGDAWLHATVDRLYRTALDRAPDGAGAAYWVGQLRAGASVNRFGGLVYGADEFYRRSGGTTTGFVTALYTRVLGRQPDGAGLAHWSRIVDRDGRGAVATAFFASTESRRDRVADLYGRLLDRSPDRAGAAYWTAKLRTTNDVRLAVALASSPEYRRRADGCAIDGTFTRIPTGTGFGYGAGMTDDGRYLGLVVNSPAAGGRAATSFDTATGLAETVSPVGCRVLSATISGDGRYLDYTTLGQADTACPTAHQRWRWDRTTGVNTELDGGMVLDSDADGSHALYASNDAGDNLRLSGPGGTVTDLPARMDEDYRAALSADGTTVAVVGGPDSTLPAGVYRWTAATGRFDRLALAATTPPATSSASVALSADGTIVAFWSDDATIVPGDTNASIDLFLEDTTTGAVQALTDVTTARPTVGPSVTMTPDASVVAYSLGSDRQVVGPDDQVMRWERSTGATVALTHSTLASVPIAITPDGDTVFIGSYDPTLAGDVGPAVWNFYLWRRGAVG